MNTFSGSAMIRFGWDAFWKRPWFFVGVSVILAIISALSGQFTSGSQSMNPQSGTTIVFVGAGFLISFIVSMIVRMGKIHLYLRAQENVLDAQFEDLWAPQKFVPFTLACLLVGIIVAVGFILLIVPGIIWALRYCFVPYLVMDKGLSVSNALAQSAQITMGHKWQLLGFFILLGLINILGALCLLVGLLVTIPVSALATVQAYRTLSSATPVSA